MKTYLLVVSLKVLSLSFWISLSNVCSKYVCELLHDTSQSGNYFTNIEVNNNKISWLVLQEEL